MNITIRKLAMLEKDLKLREEAAKLEGYSSCPIDTDLRRRITKIMDQVRLL